jgi:hypothetical protein
MRRELLARIQGGFTRVLALPKVKERLYSDGLGEAGPQHWAVTGLHLPNWREAVGTFINIYFL